MFPTKEKVWAIENRIERLSLDGAGVDGLVAVCENSEAACAFLRGGIHGLEMNLEPEFLVHFDSLCATRVICRKTFFPSLFS